MIDAKKLSAWYDFQAPLYHLWRDDYAHPLVGLVADLLARDQPQRILDVGCGSGQFSLGIALSRRDASIEGVDRSLGLLKIARRQAEKRSLDNVRFHQGDALSLEYGEIAFMSVVAAGLFPNLGEPHRGLLEMFRVLKPGGQLVVVEFDRSSMRAGTRLFFHVMIGGYRLFSRLFPRFRFADEWNIELSTIDETQFENDLRAAGFDVKKKIRAHDHLIFECGKP